MEIATIDEIIDTVPNISQGILKSIGNVCNETTVCGKDFFQAYLDSCEILEQYKIDVEEQEMKNLDSLKKHQLNLDKLTQEIISLEEDILEKQTKKQILDIKKSKFEKKKEELSHKRDVIQVYKLVTNTSFNFHSKNVTGYSSCPDTKQIVPFDYKTQHSNEEIANLLYENILSVSLNEITIADENR